GFPCKSRALALSAWFASRLRSPTCWNGSGVVYLYELAGPAHFPRTLRRLPPHLENDGVEIEAKYLLPDEETFQHLLETTNLAGFSLGAVCEAEILDRYFDTASGSVRAWGYACRVRRKGDSYVATLKGMGEESSAVHRRIEHEVMLHEPLPPQKWPPSAARDLALNLCAGEPLTSLFDIEQRRHDRLISAGSRAVAEMSLDRVTVSASAAAEAEYLELEIELLQTGTEDDLRSLTTELETVWELAPQSRSKYERALSLIEVGPPAGPRSSGDAEERLTSEERATVERLAMEREVIARRARLLLAWDDGRRRAELVEQSGLSPRRVRFWLRAFRQDRLGIFRDRDRQESGPEVSPRVAARPSPGAEATTNRSAERQVSKAVGEPPLVARPGYLGSADGTAPLGLRAVIEAGPGTEAPALTQRVELLDAPGLRPDDPMSEAGRKVLRYHFRHLLYHEPGTRLGEDIEALHDMRVATRRMRAAFRVFGDHYEHNSVAPLKKGLRRTGRALGAVRDLDIFQAKIETYQAGLPESRQGGMDDLLSALTVRRGDARQRMISYLDSNKHRRLVGRLDRFVETEGLYSLSSHPGGDDPRPYQVRDLAPVAVYERLAQVRAYDEWVTILNVPLTRLHALRIACKRLRYTLEYFREVLGPGTKSLIKELVVMQDHLGDLQDAVVASGILRDFLVWGTWGRDAKGKRSTGQESPVVAPDVAAYLAAKQSEIQHLLDGFPAVWYGLMRPEFSCLVAEAIVVL
ncbi:CHAD domain-containing protein, partial [Chloroflexota bacterium]